MTVAKLQRHSIRLRDYDYSQAGAYFVTICTQDKKHLFGEIINGEMRLNDSGKIVKEEWLRSSEIRKEMTLDEWVIMPNHLHGIVVINDQTTNQSTLVGAHGRAPLLHRQPRSLSSFIAGFKSVTTKRINGLCHIPANPVWQRNYYEHVIRDERELFKMRQYTQENPLKWDLDPENPSRRHEILL